MKSVPDPVSTYLDGLREGRRNGFAEALALLREPSEELVSAVAKDAYERRREWANAALTRSGYREDEMQPPWEELPSETAAGYLHEHRAALAAAADAMGDKG